MNEDKISKPAPKKLLAALEAEDGIPVRLLMFHRPTGLDLPGKKGATRIGPDVPTEPIGGSWEITFVPRLRAFRCIYSNANKEKPRVTFFVHETWCTWEPAEQ